MQQNYDAYRRVGLETASKPQLLLALYDGAIRFLGRAQAGLDNDRSELVHENLLKTQAILLELMSTLDMRYGEIPQQLMDLYIYMHRSLVDANVQKDRDKIGEIDGLLRGLRNAWRTAVQEYSATSPATSPAAPSAVQAQG